MTTTVTLRLPIHHARDWLARYDEDECAHVREQTARTITLELSELALADMISDALYYAEEMDRDATGDRDYRPPARTLLRALERLGLTWERRRGFSITGIVVPDAFRN